MSIMLNYAKVFTPREVLDDCTVIVSDDGKIAYMGPMEIAPFVDGLKLDLRGRIVIPGLIDVHVHGGNGITFGTEETLEKDINGYSKWVVQNGVTGFITSITAPDVEILNRLISSYGLLFEKGLPGAEALGIHLEGPYMSIEKKGAQNPDWIRDPVLTEAEAFLVSGRGWVRQMTLAPELPDAGEVASIFRKAGVIIAMGHTNADYETARKALSGNWTHVTHTYNAQTGLHHRNPGVIGAILTSDQVTTELIADLFHVHPVAMKVLINCVGPDRVVLITDAMAGAGLGDGTYQLLGFEITVKDGHALQADGTIAGSTALLNQCVRNINKEVGVPLNEAVKMASLNPARAMGFANRLGSLAVGKDASLAVIDADVNVYLTMVKGKVVYNNL